MRLDQKGFAHILLILFLILAIAGGVFLVQQKTNIFPFAKEPTSSLPGSIPPGSLEENDDYFATAVLPNPATYDSSTKKANQQIQEQNLFSALTLKPNIVFIITDDQPVNTLGINGNNIIKTPNIDSLGDKGVNFKNMYVPLGICSQSRASIWTGKLPHSHGVTQLGFILPPDQITLPEILKANGYNTAMIGKCHLGDPADPQLYQRGFDQRLIALPDNGTVPDWYNYQLLRNGVVENHTEYITDYLTTESVSYIKSKAQEYRSTKKPFFLWLAHPAPHSPLIPPKGSNRYNLDQIPLPVSINNDITTKSPLINATRMHKKFLEMGPDGVRAKLKDAYEVISNIDDNVGRINQVLEEQGIKDDTVVVYVSDNGFFYGEHQMYSKGPFAFEEQVKVPFIISYPKLTTSKKTTETLASSIDIMPTLLELAGIPQPSTIQGKSFVPTLKDSNSIHRQSVYFESFFRDPDGGCLVHPLRAIRYGEYKLIHTIEGTYYGTRCPGFDILGDDITLDGYDNELYNLKDDPYEMHNLLTRNGPSDNPLERLLTDPTLGKIIQKLRKERAIWATDTKDSKTFILTDGKVSALSTTSLEVSWKVNTGNPTAEIEYQEKNCQGCPVMQLDDFSHNPREYKYTLPNLKPDTSYTIRIFSFGARGIGGYMDLEGTTTPGQNSPVPSPTPVGKAGDIDKDGDVDIFDFNSFIQDFINKNLRSDLNKDGKVNIFDYNLFIQSYPN